jgi:hypothetical protein
MPPVGSSQRVNQIGASPLGRRIDADGLFSGADERLERRQALLEGLIARGVRPGAVLVVRELFQMCSRRGLVELVENADEATARQHQEQRPEQPEQKRPRVVVAAHPEGVIAAGAYEGC